MRSSLPRTFARVQRAQLLAFERSPICLVRQFRSRGREEEVQEQRCQTHEEQPDQKGPQQPRLAWRFEFGSAQFWLLLPIADGADRIQNCGAGFRRNDSECEKQQRRDWSSRGKGVLPALTRNKSRGSPTSRATIGIRRAAVVRKQSPQLELNPSRVRKRKGRAEARPL